MYRVMGKSDDVTTCERCGKRNLKLTVALCKDGETDVVRFGSDCAALALRGTKKDKGIIERQAGAVEAARRALVAGNDAKLVASRIWDIFGYSTQVVNGAVKIWVEQTPTSFTSATIGADGLITHETINRN